jgi:hypothetical protein
MGFGMITLHNNDDMRQPRRNIIKLKLKKQWEARQGHREHRTDTTFDNRPKRRRTRQGIDKDWRGDYDM